MAVFVDNSVEWHLVSNSFLFFVEGTPGSNHLRHSSSGLRRLLSIDYLALCAPDRRLSAWKMRAGRSVSTPWSESVASFWRHSLRRRARRRRRQHHAGVVIPAPRAWKSTLYALGTLLAHKNNLKNKGKWWVRFFQFGLRHAAHCAPRALPYCSVRGSCIYCLLLCDCRFFDLGSLCVTAKQARQACKQEITAQWAARRCPPHRE